MINEASIWLILALPVASFAILGVLRPVIGAQSKYAGWLTIAAVGGSFVISVLALASVMTDGAVNFPSRDWISVGGFTVSYGLMLDPLTAIMLVTVSGVSLLVQVYSQAYIHGDRSYTRYYIFMSLFTASMLGLVTARSVIQLFVFWELVGISSYLLIGFWMDRPSAAAAAKKAFIMTRFADFGFLLGILYLYTQNPAWLDIPALYDAVAAGAVAATAATWIALGFFMGAAGKSAQFPLHSWLPDAMEGPTPVSALIHSATMVTAGVFLVARFFPLFEASDAMVVVAIIGGITAVFAASMGLVANDIKRVLAYSTVSQLGYMMFALGVGGYVPAMFHLFTHAWFKAGLFLASGSVNHASGTFNMQYMGGLRKYMPWTYWSMVICGLSLVGLFPLSGFWSKDEILGHALEVESGVGYVVLILGLLTALLTAFYTLRMIYMTFHGEYRGGAEAEEEDLEKAGEPVPPGQGHTHLAESPWIMVAPIVIMAIMAVGAGFFTNPPVDVGINSKHGLGEFLTHNEDVFHTEADVKHAGAEPHFNWPIAIGSTALALAGIALAYGMYGVRKISPESIGRRLSMVHRVLFRKYYFDELYEDQVVRGVFYRGLVRSLGWVDRNWMDNANVQLSMWTSRFGRGLALAQNGQTQTYVLVMALGAVVAIAAILMWV